MMPGLARGGAGGHGTGGHVNGGTLPDNIVQVPMSYRMQAPLVDELMTERGFAPKAGLGGMMTRMSSDIEVGKKPSPKKPAVAAKKNPAPPACRRRGRRCRISLSA